MNGSDQWYVIKSEKSDYICLEFSDEKVTKKLSWRVIITKNHTYLTRKQQ